MIGKYLKAERKKAGVTQKQLADLLGLQQSSIAHYESDRLIPNATQLYIIKKALNTTYEALIEGITAPVSVNKEWAVLKKEMQHTLNNMETIIKKNATS